MAEDVHHLAKLACQRKPRKRPGCLPKSLSVVIGPPSVTLKDEGDSENNGDSITHDQVVSSKSVTGPLTNIANVDSPTVPSVQPFVDWDIVMKDKYGEKRFKEIATIGQGGSSRVVRVLGEDQVVYALKIVDLTHADRSTKTGFINEIKLLQQLQGSAHIITLIDYTWDKQCNKLLLLLEHGEADLANVVQQHKLTVNQIKTYWRDMLLAVKAIQDVNIVHRDLKPANFVLVRQTLKLIDFGISSSIRAEVTSVIPSDRCGTISYMAPETLQDQDNSFKVGRYSDVWSLGCILYLLVYGYTPFHHVKGTVQKMLAIVNPDHHIAFPHVPADLTRALDILRSCLKRNPKERPTISELLAHPFLHWQS
ncbi:uncharacterized protein [Dysidea avara]|uniref:uncharacterized protein n=1 Tax=Dysidea avara TaxID=196820 RepID=UPI0033349A31